MRLPVLITAALFLTADVAAQQPAVPQRSDANATIRSSSQEVLLDIVVRDKKGRPVKDLEPNDFEISDAGAVEKIKSFRLVTGNEVSTKEPNQQTENKKHQQAPVIDPTREVRLVTLAFERLGPDGRNLSRQAVRDLLKGELAPNVYYGVFMIDQRLAVLQQYTRDKDAVMRAVDKATSASYSLYTSESDRIEQELKVVAAENAAQTSTDVSGSGPPSAGQMGGMAVAAMAQMTLNMLQLNQTMDRAQAGRASIYGLMSLVKEQYRLPGRKTLLYFSEGLLIPEFLVDQFEAIIGMANRANVSVYAVDAKGLVTYAQNSAGGSMLQEAVASSRSQQNNRPQAVTPDQVRALDVADDSTRSNTQNSLADLSQSTGGFLVADTNDLRKPLQRISEDIGTYYEVTYSPTIDRYDGTFRKIAVKVSRPDVRVQTRSGYFALPFIQGQTLMPYELPMLNALSSTPVPRKIPFHSAALQFRDKYGNSNAAFVIEVPLDGIRFTKDDAAQKFKTHLSVMAIIKNSQGAIVDKFSRDVPAQGPLTELAATQAGHFIYTQHKELPPGRYTLETAVLDRESMEVSAKRQVLMVAPQAKGLAVSSLALVRSISSEASQGDPDDPFEFKGGKVTPTLDDTIKRAPGSDLSLYFAVYTQPGASEPPKLTIEFLQEGRVVGRGEPTLPAADPTGRITYIANSPVTNLKPGQYVIQATVKQGDQVAQQRTVVTLE